MRIVWDEPKRRINLEKHRLDFTDLDTAFFASAIFRPGHSRRMRAIGMLGDRLVSVVIRPLGAEGLAVVSLRLASSRERIEHDERV